MTSASRVRPRPHSWHFGSMRFIMSAAIVRSGLRNGTNAFALTQPCCLGEPGGVDALSSSSSWSTTTGGRSQGLQRRSLAEGSFAGSGSAWDGRGCQRDSAHRLKAHAALGTGFAPTNGLCLEGDNVSSQERWSTGKNVNRITKFAFSRPTVRPLTVPEEAALVGEVKTLAGYLKARENLAVELGCEPSLEEWATSVGHTVDGLAAQMGASQRAQERIVEANTGLIILMARRHHPRAFHQGTIANDLIQEGSLALLRAAETFEPRLGYRFSTYAGWWVRDRVQRCVVEQARLIRLPQHVHNFRRAIAKTEALLLEELGRPPKYEEIAKRMQVDVARVVRYANCPETLSLDAAPLASSTNGNGSAGDGGGAGRGLGGGRGLGRSSGSGYRHEKVACSMISPEQGAEAFLFQAKLNDLMSVLSPDERLVVSLRYGLGGSSPVTLNEVAEKAGSTKHRVRMVETRALNKLRRRPERNRRGRAGAALVADGG